MSVSAATSASPATRCSCPSAAPKTRRWARNGGAAGTPSSSHPKKTRQEILVVGGGPAGLECARALGQRGYTVSAARSAPRAGRAGDSRSPRCPGLTEWRRVVDWRLTQLAKMPNVGLYPASPMTAVEIVRDRDRRTSSWHRSYVPARWAGSDGPPADPRSRPVRMCSRPTT